MVVSECAFLQKTQFSGVDTLATRGLAMSGDSEKRSSDSKTTDAGEGPLGVGGRREEGPRSQEGGGYLDSCTPVREAIGGLQGGMSVALEDLRAMGLDQRWLAVAARIGVPAFLAMWETLEGERETPAGFGGEPLRVRIPSLARLRRRLRNRWIRQLRSEGHHPEDIRRLVASPDYAGELCERLSSRHITRIIGEE